MAIHLCLTLCSIVRRQDSIQAVLEPNQFTFLNAMLTDESLNELAAQHVQVCCRRLAPALSFTSNFRARGP